MFGGLRRCCVLYRAADALSFDSVAVDPLDMVTNDYKLCIE